MNIDKTEMPITDFYAIIWCRYTPNEGEENGVFEEIYKDEETAYKAMISDFDSELNTFKEMNNGREDSLDIVKGKDFARIYDNWNADHYIRWEIVKVFCDNK